MWSMYWNKMNPKSSVSHITYVHPRVAFPNGLTSTQVIQTISNRTKSYVKYMWFSLDDVPFLESALSNIPSVLDQGRWRYMHCMTTSLVGQHWPDDTARCDTAIYNQFCLQSTNMISLLILVSSSMWKSLRSKISSVSTSRYFLLVTSTLGQGSIYFNCHTKKAQRKPLARPLLRFSVVQLGQVTLIEF